MKAKQLISLSFVFMGSMLLILLMLNAPVPYLSSQYRIVSISVMIDKPQGFDGLSVWLNDIGKTSSFRGFTFAIWSDAESYILDNSTRVNILKQYGKMIPRLEYLQLNSPEDRRKIVDSKLAKYTAVLGYVPSGTMDFQPDTYTANYLAEKGLKYIEGYCFDQYALDFMTMRGGFQMPYYASSKHVLVPSVNRGIVILPHSLWDWVASFTVDHNLHTHPMNLVNHVTFKNDIEPKDYFLKLIDNSISGSSPFGFVNFQFEWSWCVRENCTAIAEDWIKTLMTKDYLLWDYETLADWFTRTFTSTPTYRVHFMSPYSGETIEWYYDTKGRVARIGDFLVSCVNYSDQEQDKYLAQRAHIDWFGPPNDPSNCVDNSLRFGLDALGGGINRAPAKDTPYPYTGSLEDFYVSDPMPEASMPIAAIVFLTTSVPIVCGLLFYYVYLKARATARKCSFFNSRPADC